MTLRPKPPSGRPAAKSGEHPAVQRYRSKLDSIDEKTAAAKADLDQKVEELLAEIRSVPPPDSTSKPKT